MSTALRRRYATMPPSQEPRAGRRALSGKNLLWGHGPKNRIWPGRGPSCRIGPVTQGPSRGSRQGSRAAYPGENLGLPEHGPGSLARMGRRLVALFIDWLIAGGLALLALSLSGLSTQWLQTGQFVVWLVVGFIAVRLFGFTPGQLVMGLQVA